MAITENTQLLTFYQEVTTAKNNTVNVTHKDEAMTKSRKNGSIQPVNCIPRTGSLQARRTHQTDDNRYIPRVPSVVLLQINCFRIIYHVCDVHY